MLMVSREKRTSKTKNMSEQERESARTIYLSELCIPVATFAGRSRLQWKNASSSVTAGLRTTDSDSGPTPWNSLLLTAHDLSMSLLQFCAQLKTEMFRWAYDWS